MAWLRRATRRGERARARGEGEDGERARRHEGGGEERVDEPGGGQRAHREVVDHRHPQVAADRGDRAPGAGHRLGDRGQAGRRRKTSAASIEASAPPWTAMPQVAAASAAASLTPSPTMTTGPRAARSWIRASLASGVAPPRQAPAASPSVGAGAGDDARVVAGQELDPPAARRGAGDRGGGVGADRVGEPRDRGRPALDGDHDRGLAAGRGVVDGGGDAGGHVGEGATRPASRPRRGGRRRCRSGRGRWSRGRR